MKITVNIADTLYEEARCVAASDCVTMDELIESGLRKVIAERGSNATRFRLRPASFSGGGLQPHLQGQSWDQIRAFSYEEREK